MGVDDLRNFLRFTTGSSVCVAESITINLTLLLVWPGAPLHIHAPMF